jgi:hypothetical protein
MKKLWALALVAVVFGGLIFNVKPVQASTFNPNLIMDDAVFDNTSTMSAAQINNFLNTFPSSCISTSNGFTAPLPSGYTPSTGFTFGVNATAGEIISTASSVYNINPQVLLATLQKEQGLVTGGTGCHANTPDPNAPFAGAPDPNSTFTCNINGTSQTCTYACVYSGGCINIAVGYDCPLYCKASSEGFSKQVIRAAWKLKFVEERSLGNYNWNIQKSGWDNSDDPITDYTGRMTPGYRKHISSAANTYYDGLYSICESGSSGCVTTTMGSGATTSLYSYTPFFSGNRSFEDKFETWFGSPFTPSYSWQVMSQYAYTDSSKSTPANPASLVSGQRIYIGFTAKNTGNQTWTKTNSNPVRVMTSGPNDHDSPFCDSTWLGCNRPTGMQENSVAPGGTATFEFWYKTPAHGFSGYEQYSLLAEGLTPLNDPQMSFYTVVSPPIYSWQLTSQYAYTDATKTTPADPANLISGQRIYVGLTAKNTGNQTWSNSGANPVHVGTSGPLDRQSSFCDSTWLGCNRPAVMQEASVAPGGTATFEFWYKTPAGGYGGYEQFRPMVEGIGWMNDPQMSFYTVVAAPAYAWQLTGEYAYTDATKTTGANPAALHKGDRIYVGFTAKNIGNQTWTNTGNNPISTGTWGPIDHTSKFCDTTWLACNRPTRLKEASVPPGGNGTFEFWYKAPSNTFTGYEQFNLVVEGYNWMPSVGMSYYSVVN